MTSCNPASNPGATADVEITKPGHPTVVYGPMTDGTAVAFKDRLEAEMYHTAHPEGTTIAIAPHTPTCEHDLFNPDAYNDPEALADMASAETLGGGVDFPDTYSRLIALHATYRTGQLWESALSVLAGRDADAFRESELDRLTGSLPTALQAALAAVADARRDLDALCSNQVFDEEMIGQAAADMAADLDEASRRLRGAHRIARLRRTAWEAGA